ncbi:MAG: phosphoenolpyruvate carboxylase [Candidatus Dormibacteraeota bacterium]|nr:phosphoenolpyruvate carboxylase [Candidatus Dormibacteraeota bacterium]
MLQETHGESLLEDVERLRRATIELRRSRGPEAEQRLRLLVDLVAGFHPNRAEAVAQAFTVYFQLVNLAEERQRVRILRQRSHEPAAVAESLSATVADLSAKLGVERLGWLIDSLEVRPVLTAHPTEARRRAVVDALARVADQAERLGDPRLAASEHADAERRLAEQVSVLWRTAQLRRQRPSPLDEVRTMTAVFDESLFLLVPTLFRELERALATAGLPAPERALGRPVLAWGSWVGGDRDGNPSVDHEVTREAMGIYAEHVLRGLENASRRIGRSLTVSEESTPPSPQLQVALDRALATLGEQAEEFRKRAPGEPHRQLLLLAADRLVATRAGAATRYAGPAEFLADLRTIQESLLASGAGRIAAGDLQTLVWQVETFGFHLASLEVRQHSEVHRQALAVPDSDRAREVVATLRVMAELQSVYGSEACRRYVVSFTRSAADVMAVYELAALAVADGSLELDVVPLFESRADLEQAPAILDELLGLPAWRAWLDGRHRRLEVMLGYSDAAKDAGFLAANLALYHAQDALAEWARRNRVQLTLFHGRGGAVGRGGGPAGRAIRSQAPGSVAGRFKVTEQGEVIFGRYGNPAIGLRHLEQVLSAVLVASTPDHEAQLALAGERFAAAAELMAGASEEAYRGLVEAPGFADFLARVSPLDEISRLRIGSRPARREADGKRDLEGLRAIPWVFAWTQNRCNLPGWFGLGTGLQIVAEKEGIEHLRQMRSAWPFFESILDNAEMSLAKADPMIAGLYLELGGRSDLVDVIREEYRLTRRLVLAITGNDRLLAAHPILRQAVDLRNPYVDALSFLQLRFLRELRGGNVDGPAADRLADLVLLTVNGVAAGLQNTG